MNIYTSNFFPIEIEKYRTIFEKESSTFCVPQYMYFQAKGNGFTASFYTSGKFVIQGKRTSEIISKYFDIQIQNTEIKSHYNEGQIAPYPHIGIDESGKGDFFGPLVIAGVLIDENTAKTLRNAGVEDSKKMNDKKILELENLIKKLSTFDVIAINPVKYNELYVNFKNLNKLLAWGHSTVLENILVKRHCEIAISDKFADENIIKSALKERGKTIRLIQQTKAECDTAVAAASVLARAEFVKRISSLCEKYEINLPKGASNLVLEQGKKFITKYGKEELKNIAKMHFKTSADILKS